MFDLPNAALGVLYYSYIILFLQMPIRQLGIIHKLMASAAMASSLFLAYQLTFVLRELCVLCWSTHVVNTILFYNIVLKEKASASKQKNE
jgi:vitamin-K-epoxide reductase (warfarin-sensitive)